MATTEIKKPKFKKGDIVELKRATLYDEVVGEITEEPYRDFKEIEPKTGKFDRTGLVISESTIDMISLPHDFDGETLVIHYSSYSLTYKFYGYSYNINTLKMASVYPERLLILKK